MKRYINYLFFLIIILVCKFYADGSFSVGIYGNLESTLRDQSSKIITTNADWYITDPKGYIELKLSGLNFEGFNLWSKLGANIEFQKGNLYQMNQYFPNVGITNPDTKNDNFTFHQFEAHIQKSFDLSKVIQIKGSKLNLIFFRSQDRTYIGQPYLDFFGDIFDGDTKTGLQWEAINLWGFNSMGFIIDYRSDLKDLESADKFAYAFAIRVNRDIWKSTILNANFGITGGGNQYFLSSLIESFGIKYSLLKNYYYNVLGCDLTINGDNPLIGSYYLFNGIGRSYAPEKYPFEYYPFISLLGNSNSLIWDMEAKWNRKFEFGNIDFGTLYAGFYLHLKQPNFQGFMGASVDNKYIEKIDLTYHFPVKAVSISSYMEYKHNYEMASNYHIWEIGNIYDSSVELKRHIDLNIMFKNGFSFNIAYDNQAGLNYLGSFDPEGLNFITLVTKGEGKFGKISPQLKIVALGDTNKQVITTGIEILVNLSSWSQLYSRFGYAQSAGFWKTSEGNLDWWNAFIQLQFKTGDNSKILLELGNGGDTGDGLVSDADLIKGKIFDKKVYFKWEYWL